MHPPIRMLGRVIVALMVLALTAPPVAAARPAAIVTGSGTARLTYTGTDLPPGPHLATFRIVGIVGADGSANGQVNVVFTGAGASAWGAVPGVALIDLAGTVASGTVTADGTVELRGRLTETDYRADGAIGFQSEEPFMITAGAGRAPDAFVLQWCLLAPYAADVTQGHLHVHTPGESAAAATTFGMRARGSCGTR